jgi:hypothetical protein
VLAIYEGTNGIQANDLVFRKIVRDDGAAFRDLLGEAEALLPELQKASGDAFPVLRTNLSEALAATRDAGAWILETAKADTAWAAASAAPFLRLMGNTLGGYYLFKTALLAAQDAGSRSGDPDYLASKIITARFYAEHVLTLAEGLARVVKDGGGVVLQAEGDKFFG